MNLLIVLFLVTLILAMIFYSVNIKINIGKIGKKFKSNINNNIYSKKDLMTKYEKYFYEIFKELEGKLNIKIHPQINLATIINKDTNNYYISELFRNIDFAVFDKNYENLILLIEINDSTHKTRKRIVRDKKVSGILKDVGIPLMKFYSNYPNEKSYVKNRVKNKIIELKEKN